MLIAAPGRQMEQRAIMSAQSYQRHVHHPIPAYVASLFGLVAMVAIGGQWFFGSDTRDVAILALACAVIVLIAVSRLNTVALQDRIIMLEMKVRCSELLPAAQDADFAKLSKRQLVALRFASDTELGGLLERAAKESLAPDDIKAAIRSWRPDPYRT